MKPEELDEIFQIEGGVPIIAGLYIGMDEEEAEEKTDELNSYKTEKSPDYPLISSLSITFEYDLFEYENVVKRIRLILPQECSKNDSDFIFDYLSKKIYHERIHRDVESKTNNQLLHLNVEIANYYYSCSFFNKDGHFVIQLSGIVEIPELYKAFYLTGTNEDLKSFICQSLSFRSNAGQDKFLNRLFSVYSGYPAICGVYLGYEATSSSETERIMDEELKNAEMNYKNQYYWDISFEVMIDGSNRVDEIIMRLPEQDKEETLNIIRFFKQRLLIENGHYYFADGKEDFKINVSMSNKYFSVKAGNPYRLGRRDVEITLNAVKKDQSDLYRTLYVMLSDNTHFGYFKAADVFYGYDSENNFLPVGAYDSYEEAIEAFQGD